MTPSAIDAIREGRAHFPKYVSGRLITLIDSAGNPVRRTLSRHGEFRFALNDGSPPVGKITCGSSCLLGAQALGMDFSPTEVADGGSLYVHPDFIIDPETREKNPRGFFSNVGISGSFGAVLRAPSPCECDDGSGDMSVPDIIAHLNDDHDPSVMGLHADMDSQDGWPEARIVAWLRSLGIRDSAASY